MASSSLATSMAASVVRVVPRASGYRHAALRSGLHRDHDAGVPERQRIAAYGICRDGDGRILLARASPAISLEGLWFLPGGGVDHGEHPIDSLRREIEE